MSRRNLFWLLGIASVSLFGLTVSYSAPPARRTRITNWSASWWTCCTRCRQPTSWIRSGTRAQAGRGHDQRRTGTARSAFALHQRRANTSSSRSRARASSAASASRSASIARTAASSTVISPMAGTPAYEAGVLAGDIILKIDGKSTENMRMNEAVEMIQGEPGPEVTLTVLHEGTKEPVDMDITRADHRGAQRTGRPAQDRRSQGVGLHDRQGQQIGYIRLTSFSKTAAKELRRCRAAAEARGIAAWSSTCATIPAACSRRPSRSATCS